MEELHRLKLEVVRGMVADVPYFDISTTLEGERALLLSTIPCVRFSEAEERHFCERVRDSWHALAGVPDPAAYCAAFEGMRKALEYVACDIEGDFPEHELVPGGDNSLLGGYRDKLRDALAQAEKAVKIA